MNLETGRGGAQELGKAGEGNQSHRRRADE
jgi:hypothetical protein